MPLYKRKMVPNNDLSFYFKKLEKDKVSRRKEIRIHEIENRKMEENERKQKSVL